MINTAAIGAIMSAEALSGHPTRTDECPLLGVKRTLHIRDLGSANDPKQTWEGERRQRIPKRLGPTPPVSSCLLVG
jgi:hypothetical protein